ncbi:MAG TPA: adenylate/guanylate cyclase domain-containing protein [Acidimicrobiales bacterium]|nr:adenylate/guanylate cyclase domain-containing protein [Acidimicrobiales bacterium]
MAPLPRTSYAKSGGLNIAYQVFGDGPRNLVHVPGFVTHLDLQWENPHFSEANRRFATFARTATFDKRNTGLSDRTSAAPTMEERIDDIRAVMDAAGMEAAAIVGHSEGGPMSLLFAATYPERVEALVLGGTYARLPPFPDMEERLGALEQAWGTGVPLQFFLPASDLEWAARYERSAATPRGAVEILRLNALIDVSAALPAVSAPTLVLHRTGDPIVPISAGRELAEGIAGAQFVELAGETHSPANAREWQEEVDLIEEFLTGAHRTTEPDRVLATVLFTDIVDSTEHAAGLGDRAWTSRLEANQQRTGRLVRQFGGRLVKTTGDGVLATFDGPARAIRCASALTDQATRDRLPIRAGLHTGEVELVGDDIAGIAVHLAKRVEAAAVTGAVFVSQTVRDLVVGSGIELADRGTHELKGIPGSWTLYEVRST